MAAPPIQYIGIHGREYGLSPLVGRDVADLRHMGRDIVERIFQMHALVRRLMFGDADTRPPLLRGTYRPRREAAAAIRADIAELGLDAVGAEGAFVGADARVECVRRQIL